MDVALLALWYACGLGAAVFASAVPLRTAPAAIAAIAFGVVTWGVGPAQLLVGSLVGLTVAVAAVVQLVRSVSPMLCAAMAGALAGAWTGVLEIQGIPAMLAPVIAASVPVSAAWCARRSGRFAPALLRDEAFLFIAGLGAVTAAAPGLADGWRAAINLSAQGASSPSPVIIPAWTITLTILAATLGGLYSLWSRR